ncbi:hypothetical protein C8A01DRAFT_18393 [Parachaetomium inaequale]|uniref:C2H2-type domain-containing protein n=1 Tax=Parachaetomium inaequale TaxID=2588326 RepID=A0AAN6SP45_9PEZI|nr:hypothetical protein C8A01DRAFT_18393 [Parachaetomium inaequale]
MCYRLRLNDTSRVKQHLGRKHAPEFYCERCRAIFPNEETHRRHHDSQSCTPQPHRFAGITHQQQRRLSRKSRSSLSEAERWFDIWDIVFPGQPRPASPYVDANLSEDLSRFKEFAHTRGLAMIAAEVRSGGLDISPAMEPEAVSALEQTISRGFVSMFETWTAEHGLGPFAQQTAPGPTPLGDHTNLDEARSVTQEPPANAILFADNGTVLFDSIPDGEARLTRAHGEQRHEGRGSCPSALWNGLSGGEADAEFDWGLERYSFFHDATGQVNPVTQGGTAGVGMAE